ncbi:MAG: 2-C-methyl-D-erythritol 4-phosphate cytidylyltransferase [Desulfuromonadales bacterium]|nr:2-C-methyl-D-erythritol 4-phosphate cytidylyltransferase [Desulfuromonadales bacterium]
MSGKTLAIVPAGGSGRRMGADKPKQYLSLAGSPILVHTLKALHASPAIAEIYLVTPSDDMTYAETLLKQECPFEKITRIIAGGPTRQDSTRNGILASGDEHGILLIHDGVRPFITADLIERVIRAATLEGAAIAAVPVRETVKKLGEDHRLTTINREDLWLAQTPQAFRRDIIWKAHEDALKNGILATDDAALVERMGIAVKLVQGAWDNIKITTPEDLALAELLVKKGKTCG